MTDDCNCPDVKGHCWRCHNQRGAAIKHKRCTDMYWPQLLTISFRQETYTPFICGEESFGTGADHVREKDCRAQHVCLASLGAEKTSHSDEQSPQNGIGSKRPQIGVLKINCSKPKMMNMCGSIPYSWSTTMGSVWKIGYHKVPLNPVAYHRYHLYYHHCTRPFQYFSTI